MMIALIKRLLAPPVFDEDEEKTRKAALLNTLLVASFSLITIYLLTIPLLLFKDNPLWTLIRYPPVLISWVLMRKGYVRAACAFFVASGWVTQVLVWASSGGPHSPGVAGIIVLVLLAGMLLGNRAAFLLAFLSTLTSIVLVYAQSRDLLPELTTPYTPVQLLIDQGVWAFLAAILLSLSMSSLHQALRRARDELAERKRAEQAMRATEARFSKAFNASPNPMTITTIAEGRLIEVNETFLKTSNLSREKIIGRTIAELNLYVNAADRINLLETLQRQGNVRNFETSYQIPDGEERVSLVAADLIELDGEQCILASILDITERKQAEEALRRSEERYRLIVENQTEFIVKWLPDGRRTFVNESYCRYFGLSEEDCLGSSFMPLVAPEFRDLIEQKIAALTPENPQATSEHLSFAADGEQRWQQWTDRGIFDVNGKLLELQSTGRDITERKRAEAALRASEERFSKAFNGSPTPMAIHSLPDVRYMDVNDAFVSAGEFTREQVIGRTWSELKVWADSEEQDQVLKALRERNGRVRNMEARFHCKGGEVRVGVFSSDVITLDGQECLLSVVNDITERKQAEEKQLQLQEDLQKSAMEWRRTFDSVESVLLILDLDGRIIRLNRAAKELAGLSYEEIIGRAVETLGSGQPWPEAAELVRRIRESRRTISTQTQDEARTTAWDLTSSMISGFGVDERIIIVARDITRMVKLQDSLRRSETMSAMGALVAGVAHEVRNPLFSISATLDAFDARFGEREEYQQYINILRGELKRLNDLMRDLLEYGKPFELELSQGSIREVVTKAIRYCDTLMKRSNVEIVNLVGNDLAPIRMDHRRVVQVFRNVIENAVQHSSPGAVVTVKAEQIRQRSLLWVTCRIGDSGPGFRTEELPKIFEPFFTRRRGGTGIGLSIVQRIMEEHGGQVSASNHSDGGAVVELTFQAIEP
jgi:PAS domain S-box-containing protein